MIDTRVTYGNPCDKYFNHTGTVVRLMSERNNDYFKKFITYNTYLVRFDDGVEVECREHWLHPVVLETPKEAKPEKSWFDDLNTEYKK